MKEVIDSSLRRVFQGKIMETLKTLILIIIVLNLATKSLIVPFIDSSSYAKVFLKISQNLQENTCMVT